MERERALIAMSGGVDSTVAALLAIRAGFACFGVTMKLYGEGDVADAAAAAQRLGMPHEVLNLKEDFNRLVVEDFARTYEEGRTPNPCIRCNRYLKFGKLLQEAQRLGCGKVVSGHYARITRDEATGRFLLRKAVDEGKDQSYVLCRLTQEQAQRIFLPLGELSKTQVRQIAREAGLENADKQDSQDICFIPDGNYLRFLEEYRGKPYEKGNFLDVDGNILGTHNGAVGYTIGQRKGLGLAMGAPVYVCAKNMKENTVTVGPESLLMRRELLAEDWSFFPFPQPEGPIRVAAKVRYRQQEQPATVYPEGNGVCRVLFDLPQRGITPGQTVALYDGDTVVGGGTITTVL